MAADFDTPPFYDKLTDEQRKDYMSALWIEWISTFGQTLASYLSAYGMYVPRITQEQREAIQQPSEGQMIYNTTILAPQIWQNGIWQTFTTSVTS
jgi:hypothetical protein